MATFPDFLEPLVGYRTWRVDAATLYVAAAKGIRIERTYRLHSWITDEEWNPLCAQTALHYDYDLAESDSLKTSTIEIRRTLCDMAGGPPCSLHVPHSLAGCGIYAVLDEHRLTEWLARIGPQGPLVIGTVSLWGRVAVHDHGYRAQFAYPRTIIRATGCDGQAVAAAYGIPYQESETWILDGPCDV